MPLQLISTSEFSSTIGITTSIPKELSGNTQDTKTTQISRVDINHLGVLGIDETSLSLVLQIFKDDLNNFIIPVIDELTEEQLERTFIQIEYEGTVIIKSFIYL